MKILAIALLFASVVSGYAGVGLQPATTSGIDISAAESVWPVEEGSLVFWIYTFNDVSQRAYYDIRGDANNNSNFIFSEWGGHQTYTYKYKANGVAVFIRFQDDETGFPATGQWIMVTTVWKENNYARMYINGVLRKAEIVDDWSGAPDEGLVLLNNYIITSTDTTRRADDYILYDRVLAVEEMLNIYGSRGASYPRNGIVGHWPLDGCGEDTGGVLGSGDSIVDVAGGYDGVVAGTTPSLTVVTAPTRKSSRGRR